MTEQNIELYQGVKAMLSRGDYLQAYDALWLKRDAYGNELRWRQLIGLSLARCGATERARDTLVSLRREGHLDGETSGLLARTFKDLWQKRGNRYDLLRSFSLYSRAYRRAKASKDAAGAIYNGTNAATLALVAGARGRAHKLAAAVAETCEQLRKSGDADYWSLASLAECRLVRGELESALLLYTEAIKLAPGRQGDIASTRRNAHLILDALEIPRETVDNALPLPVVLYVGPAAKVRDLEQIDSRAGVICFTASMHPELLETAVERRWRLRLVLPAPRAVLLSSLPTDHDRERIVRALDKAERVSIGSERSHEITEADLAFAARYSHGMALLEAGALSVELALVGEALESIPLSGKEPGSKSLRAVVFADAVNFSELADDKLPEFIDGFFGLASRLMRENVPPIVRNTWGDALFAVYESAEAAGDFALAFAEALQSTFGEESSLSRLQVRVAVDAGPIMLFQDPVRGARNAIGVYVTRAARLEPVTPPGQVYASESYAALLALEASDAVTCGYVGRVALAKAYGTIPTYHLGRNSVRGVA